MRVYGDGAFELLSKNRFQLKQFDFFRFYHVRQYVARPHRRKLKSITNHNQNSTHRDGFEQMKH